MLRQERYTCVKCGKSFTKTDFVIIHTPIPEQKPMIHLVCDECKRIKIADIFGMKK